MKKSLSDGEWNKLAEKNAKHSAKLHIESHNAAKIAEAFKDVPALKALEFLFKQAEKYRRENKHKKAATVLEAAQLIDRKTGQGTEIVLQTRGEGKNEDTTLSVRRFTPDEIFGEPVVFREIIEEEETVSDA